MKEYTLAYKPNNIEVLHARIQAVFGDRYDSMGSSDEGVWFRFKDDGQEGDEATLQAELDAHDPNELSERQQKMQRRKPDVDALREKVKQAGKRDELLTDILDALEYFEGRLGE